MDHSARKKNVENAFEARSVSSQRIILLDDVTTSGATLSEAAKALRRAGARNIIALTVAKA
jgi:predicted amidophosphoribosyltransferase